MLSHVKGLVRRNGDWLLERLVPHATANANANAAPIECWQEHVCYNYGTPAEQLQERTCCIYPGQGE